MKKIILLLGFMLISSCGSSDDKECICTKQQWTRRATYAFGEGKPLISSTAWEKRGSEQPDINDCDRNGKVEDKKTSEPTISADGTKYSIREYEYRVTCK